MTKKYLLFISLILIILSFFVWREGISPKIVNYFHKEEEVETRANRLSFGDLLVKEMPRINFGDLLIKIIPSQTVREFVSSLPLIGKKKYVIAIFGDSMVDTMGEKLEYLDSNLKREYPGMKFSLYNYGMGAQNAGDGLTRFNSPFKYKTRDYPAISQLKPDILIIGSFAYNPFDPHDLNRYQAALQQLILEAKKISPDVYLLVEIAPLKKDFGKGLNGVNWDADTAYIHAGHIIEQLESAINTGKSTRVVVIDAFTPSQVNAEKEGKRAYINPDDGIHPSASGQRFMADLIASTINLK